MNNYTMMNELDCHFQSYTNEQLHKLAKIFSENPVRKLQMPCVFHRSDIVEGSRWYYFDAIKSSVVEIEFTFIRSEVYFFIDVNNPGQEEFTTIPSLQLIDMEPAVFYAPYPFEVWEFFSRHGKTKIIYPPMPTLLDNE